MKRLYLFIILTSIITLGAAGETNLTGTDLFQLSCHTDLHGLNFKAELLDCRGHVITKLPHIVKWTKMVHYSNGMIIYQAYSEYKTGKWGERYGAIDLCGNVAVPFRYKTPQDVMKSKEYTSYTMSDACRKILADAQNDREFKIVKNKLDKYRQSRYAQNDILGNSFFIHNYEVREVLQNGRKALVDYDGNFITTFDYNEKHAYWAWYDKLFALGDKSGTSFINLAGEKEYGLPANSGYYIMTSKYYRSGGEQIFGGPFNCNLDKVVTHKVNINMSMWYNKDEFESLAEFKARTTPEMCRKAQEYFASAAVRLFMNLGMPRPFTLGDYDRENESFLIESPVGNVAMKIPFEESMNFRSAWEGKKVRFEDPRFSTVSEGVTLTSLNLKIEDDNRFYLADTQTKYARYIMGDAKDIASPVIAVVKNPNPVEQKQFELALGNSNKKLTPADVDIDIPAGSKRRDRAFALIIANEDYTSLAPVPFARNDGEILAQYCTRTLGMPAQNVKTYFNATYGQMDQAITDMRKIAEVYGGDIDLLVYYAGHGAPDESTSKAYLLPADADGINPRYCIGRDYLLGEISAMKARNAVVMFDACFTGAERTDQKGKMLVDARTVEIEPEGPEFDNINCNVRVLNATSGRQTAMPDRENSHGLFTYYLLKKLRENRGEVSIGDLWNYLDTNIPQRSVVLGKMQRPSIIAEGDWRSLLLLP